MAQIYVSYKYLVLHSSTILHKLIFKQEKERNPLFFLQKVYLCLSFTIKKATTNDIQLINEMAQIVFPATYREILSKEQLDYMMDWMYSPKNLRKQIEEEGHIYYIAYKDGEAAGYVSIQPEGEHLFHLQKIYVLPRFQGCRLGKALFEQAVKAIKEIHPGPCEMHLNVNRNNKALQFYQHLGMEKVAEGDFHIGNGYYMNDYIMGLKI